MVKEDLQKTIVDFFFQLAHPHHIGAKSANASKVEDYKPISYYMVFYKVISKTLMGRLVIVVEDILYLAQTTFIRGKSIIDNIHLAQVLHRKYKRKNFHPNVH